MIAFPGDTYTTPADQKTDWQDFVLLRSRWWLYLKFVGTVFRSRRLIDENRYSNENWAQTSLDVMRAIESVGGRFDISGIDNLRKAPGPLKRKRLIHIAFGEAMPLEKREKETHQRIVDFISTQFSPWKEGSAA